MIKPLSIYVCLLSIIIFFNVTRVYSQTPIIIPIIAKKSLKSTSDLPDQDNKSGKKIMVVTSNSMGKISYSIQIHNPAADSTSRKMYTSYYITDSIYTHANYYWESDLILRVKLINMQKQGAGVDIRMWGDGRKTGMEIVEDESQK